ncbi:MAG: cob(I)yrinic acid a,c-diamide adenosyltransferase [Flavobacteriales bacterium]|nr:cob(I)yrinic acid a,c-diamide adenosyltransferase [Flavobacteriales bacterium]MBL0043858.1 cob(I)yrinic acid a,c-diamide adenosyltransferase [Flavobacteriales bacterium]
MKIYTRTGDKGQTSLLGGMRVPKDHARIEAYGTIDELNSHLGMLRDLAGAAQKDLLITIQENLFSIGSRLASASELEADKFKVPHLEEADISMLEAAMDSMDKDLPEMRNFILPGGHPAVSQAHICRTICRRAERLVVRIAEQEQLPESIIRYLNRLSDLLFVLARWLSKQANAEEIPWKPRG